MTGNFGADFDAQASFDASAALDAAADLAASASVMLDAGLDASLRAGLGASFDASLSASLNAGLGASANPKCRVGAHVPDPWLKFRFKVEIDQIGIVRFKRVESFALKSRQDTTQDATRGVNGGASMSSSYLPPRAFYWEPVTLKRGMAHDGVAIWKWVEETATARRIKPRNVVITLLDAEGKFAMQWTLRGAYPIEWLIEALDASANEVVIEALKLVHQGITVQFQGGGFNAAASQPPSSRAPAVAGSANASRPGGANANNAPGANGANRSTTQQGRPPPQPTGNAPTSGGVQSGGAANHGRNSGT